MRIVHRGVAGLLAVGLSACAALPPEIPEAGECRANYLGFEQKVAAAHARNAGAHRIEGFPYLRSDRFLASFRDEVPDGPRFDAWVERLRRLDLEARASELKNLGGLDPGEELAHLDRCGKAWAAADLADPARRALLRKNAAVPDDYSTARRVLGLYPVAVPFLDLGIEGFDDDVRADYAKPVAALDSAGPLMLWRAQGAGSAVPPPAPWLASAPRDALGIPQLSEAQWHALAQAHEPSWLVESGGDYDLPGAVVLKDGEPALDAETPVTYFLHAYTRFGNKVLPQLVYVVWFSERPRQKTIDSYAGRLDGLVWRVTLDGDGQPLLYDTIHPCGCYHYYFRAKPLRRRAQGGWWDEPQLFPQDAPPEPFAVRIQSATHYVRRLVPLAQVRADAQDYALRDYAALLTLPNGAGTRSLFCEDGIVCGTERLERLWLWPAGIDSPGAMRQWGRHATSFVGRSHFDEPHLLDRLFAPD